MPEHVKRVFSLEAQITNERNATAGTVDDFTEKVWSKGEFQVVSFHVWNGGSSAG